MRGLFKDQEDGTLFAAEISVVQYDPDGKQLIFYSLDDDEIQIPHIERYQADAVIKELYRVGIVDFTSFDSYLNEDAPRADEDEQEKPDEVKVKSARGIFGRKPKAREPWDV